MTAIPPIRMAVIIIRAMLCDRSGRHLVTMPHIERSIFPWNWAYYPKDSDDEISPWLAAFTNAREWVEKVNTP